MKQTKALFKRFKQSDSYGTIELLSIALFVSLAAALLFLNPRGPSPQVDSSQQTSGVTAQANAMPHQGWAPLQTYFSAYGSQSNLGEIVKYEWDLDGNGLYDTDATTSAGYVQYNYTKPGDYTISLRITDAAGNLATDSLTVSVRHPASSPVDYWTIFDDSQVRKVEFQLTKANWALMWQDPEAKTTVRADAIIFGDTLSDVGLRFRGQFSLRESGEKKPFKIDTDYFVDGQEYHNLKQLMFINNIGDPTMIQEKLTYEMLYFAGVPASHVSYVEIWIDISDDDAPATFWGVYTMVERVDKKYLASRFGKDNDYGNLYKASHAQRGPMDLIYYGNDISDYPTQNGQVAYGKVTNEEENDYSDVIELAYIVDGATYATNEEFTSALETVFNVDTFLRYMAVMVTVSSWDYYPYTGNNFHLYHNPADGRFEWIPWDQTWGGDARQPLYGRADFGMVERAPLYDRILAVPAYQRKYEAYLDLLARYWFNKDNITEQAGYYHQLIAPYLTQGAGDKMYFGDTPAFPYEEFLNSWNYLPEFASERSQFILSTLAQNPEE